MSAFWSSMAMMHAAEMWQKLENPWRYKENRCEERCFLSNCSGVNPIDCCAWNRTRNLGGLTQGGCCETGNGGFGGGMGMGMGGGCCGTGGGCGSGGGCCPSPCGPCGGGGCCPSPCGPCGGGGCCPSPCGPCGGSSCCDPCPTSCCDPCCRPSPQLRIPSSYGVGCPFSCSSKTSGAMAKICCGGSSPCCSPCGGGGVNSSGFRYRQYQGCWPRNCGGPYTSYYGAHSGGCCGGYEHNHDSYIYNGYNGGCNMTCKGCPTTYNNSTKTGWGGGPGSLDLNPCCSPCENKGCCIPWGHSS